MYPGACQNAIRERDTKKKRREDRKEKVGGTRASRFSKGFFLFVSTYPCYRDEPSSFVYARKHAFFSRIESSLFLSRSKSRTGTENKSVPIPRVSQITSSFPYSSVSLGRSLLSLLLKHRIKTTHGAHTRTRTPSVCATHNSRRNAPRAD